MLPKASRNQQNTRGSTNTPPVPNVSHDAGVQRTGTISGAHLDQHAADVNGPKPEFRYRPFLPSFTLRGPDELAGPLAVSHWTVD